MAQPHYLPQGPCGWLPPPSGGSWQGGLPFFPAHMCTGLMPPRVQGQRAPVPVPPPFQFLHRPPVQPPCEPPFAPSPGYYNPGFPPFMEPQCPLFSPHGRRGRGGFLSPPPFAPLNTHPFPPRGPRSYRGAQKKNKVKTDSAQDVGRGQGGGAGMKEPAPGDFACATCSKEYKSAETLQVHIEAHKKCYQCDFEAIPRVLKEHRLIHLLPDELKFSSEEEIRKWREERRKNYPTTANVAKKRKLEAEKKNRGEVARTPLHRYISHLIGECSSDGGRRGWGYKRGRGRGRVWPRKGERGQRNGQSRRGQGSEEFTVLEDMPDAGSEEEANDQSESCRKPKQQPESSSLTIMPNTEEAQPRTITMETVASGHQLEGNDITEGRLLSAVMADMSKQCAQGQREKCGKRPVPKGRQKTPWKGPRKRQKREVIGARRPTLLEKLLAPEIRREQNTLLQCIHHIVREDFFGTGTQAETTDASLEPEFDQTTDSEPKSKC